jgi:REP element-mobilizing transposase RayT
MTKYPRVPPRLDRLFASDPVFFVTACIYRRRPLLADDAVNNILRRFGERAYAEHGIALGRYVIMPDHIHLFVCGPNDFDLGRWMGMLKQCLEKAVTLTASQKIWQRGFFDHVLRNEESYGQKWEYVRDNPVRAGLVSTAEDWPYAGEIITIDRI